MAPPALPSLLPLQREVISRGAITTHCFSSFLSPAETLDVLFSYVASASAMGWDGSGMRTMIFQPFNFNPLFPFSRSNVDVSAAALDDDGHVNRRRDSFRGDVLPDRRPRAAAAASPLVFAPEDKRVTDVASAAATADFFGGCSTSDILSAAPSSSRAHRRLHNHDAREGFVSRLTLFFTRCSGARQFMQIYKLGVIYFSCSEL